MVEKLKSISKRIHWSLVLKGVVFGLAWLWLPWWLFFIVALVLYFVPRFQAWKLALPFAVLLVLSYISAPTAIFALIFGASFYFLLLIKDLLLINRRAAHELLVFVLSFILLRDFYLRFSGGIGGWAMLFAFIVAGMITLLMRNYIKGVEEHKNLDEPLLRAGSWLSFLVFAQLLIVGLFLPLDFVYQTIVVFLPIVLIVDLLPDHLEGRLIRGKIMSSGIAVFAMLIVVLASARWGL